ncbi:MAG TPA: MucB/RseB C-terminal domain-containing protein [Rhodocyclaceae bacterium]|nr:MucB/RseB C-terminal domain-containing protein [Rhodocyclaceae bacterium]
MKRWLLSGLCCLLAYSLPAAAQQQDGLYWLDRVVTAAHKLNYSGTFVFQSGALVETSRITHMVVAGREQERIEVLDGSPREVISGSDEVRCYLPESRTLIVEKRSRQRSFPALLPAVLGGLAEHYVIRKGALGRIADRESQAILLEPKDRLRYGHQFWVDVNSGLLLKAELLNEHNEPVETFAFTQLQIGGAIDRESLTSKYAKQASGWQVHNVRATERRGEDAAWRFKVHLPGFSKLTEMMREVRPNAPASLHIMFSDGLAAISVFIDSVPAGQPSKTDLGMIAMGATNIYRRIVGGHLLVIMGEVPPATLKKFGDGIEPR